MACACWHGINRSGATAGVCDVVLAAQPQGIKLRSGDREVAAHASLLRTLRRLKPLVGVAG